MKKELFQIDYVLKNGSASLLWKMISTPSGLSEWFAENVEEKNKIFSFQWGNSIQNAKMLSITPGAAIRFHWEEETDDSYFEFRFNHSEITRELVLSVIDFAEPSDKKSSIDLWNSQIETLTRRSGM